MGTGIHGHTLKSAMTNAAKLNKMIESELARRQKRKTSIEMKHFNRMLLQKINLVKPQISIHDVSFTRAQVTSNYSEVRVFWKPRTNDQDEPALGTELEHKAPQLEVELNQMNIGAIPTIVFVRDRSEEKETNVEEIFDQLALKNAHQPEHNFELQTCVLNFDREQVMNQITQALELAKAKHRSE